MVLSLRYLLALLSVFLHIRQFAIVSFNKNLGHLKFWKKKGVGIEFAKHFRSHLGPIEGLAVSIHIF